MVKRYENLFICITLLQLKIVTKIIEKKGLNKQNCCCFYYSNQNTLANKYYLSKLKKRCSKIINFRNIYSFPKYFFLLKKIFKNFNVKNVYVTNIDGIYVQFILSIINPKNIYTFDDGAGNLYKNTNYNIGNDFGIFKSFIYRLFGNKYSIAYIKKKSKKHFSVFKNYKNYSSKNIQNLNLYEKKNFNHVNKNKKSYCNLFLGTVLSEYFSTLNNHDIIKHKLNKFLFSLKGDTFYLKHPRSRENLKLQKIKKISSFKIAEDLVIYELLKKYKTINLYAFPVSTVQINLEKFSFIKNFVLITDNLPQRSFDGMRTLKKKFIKIKL